MCAPSVVTGRESVPSGRRSSGQQCRILVFRLHDHAIALKALEILGQSASDTPGPPRANEV